MKPVLIKVYLQWESIDFSLNWLTAYKGLEIPNLHMEQLIIHIHMLLKYGHLPDEPTGHNMQLEAELNGSLFNPVGLCA